MVVKTPLPTVQTRSRQATHDTLEAIPPREGVDAGMTSELAAAEGKFDATSFTDMLNEGVVEAHDNSAYDANLWSDEFGNALNLSGMETPSESFSDAAGLVKRGFADVVEGTEVGTSTVTVGQQLGPQDIDKLDLDACVNTALFSLPTWAPKPIWEENIWAAILGDGILMKSDFCTAEFYKPSFVPCLNAWMGQISECSRKLKRSMQDSLSDSYADVVRHVTDQSWQEERESLLQAALKRWLVVVISFDPATTVWVQLAAETDDVGKLTVLGDLFRGKAPTTLLKRARAVEKLCGFFGVGAFPTSEQKIYQFFQYERSKSAPPSRLKSYLEALAFCFHVFSMSELKEVVASKRLHGCTIPAVPTCVIQAAPLTVEELTRLHEILQDQCDWNSAFAGAVLFVVYSRARWADAMHSHSLLPDLDESGITRYLEATSAVHKTMHASIYRHKMLPLVAPAVGVVKTPWVDRWMEVRKHLNILMPPDHALMPAPSGGGQPTQRPLSATEAGAWLRKLLFGSKEQLEHKRVSAHSMKATTLSFAAKYGVDAETRLQLAYHVGGFKMLHTYSRDAAAQPLLELEKVLTAIREGRFRPDSTRSGRFIQEPSDTHACESMEVVDLTEPKEEETSIIDEVQSSSSDESEEEFPASNGRIFKPPVAPEGYTFWQHRKLRTLHLTLPEYKRVLMCNRMIGPQYTQEGMIIRYDTPVCRQCATAVRG